MSCEVGPGGLLMRRKPFIKLFGVELHSTLIRCLGVFIILKEFAKRKENFCERNNGYGSLYMDSVLYH